MNGLQRFLFLNVLKNYFKLFFFKYLKDFQFYADLRDLENRLLKTNNFSERWLSEDFGKIWKIEDF